MIIPITIPTVAAIHPGQMLPVFQAAQPLNMYLRPLNSWHSMAVRRGFPLFRPIVIITMNNRPMIKPNPIP
jgi:hypothetical protein